MHFLGFLHVENKGLAMTHNQFTINIQIPLKSTEMLSVPFFQWGSKCSNHATYGPLIRAIQLKKIPVCGATSAIEGISRDRVHLVGVLSVCAPNCRAEHLVVHARGTASTACAIPSFSLWFEAEREEKAAFLSALLPLR